MADCTFPRERISGLIDGALTPEEARETETHISACPACRELHGRVARMRALLRAAAEEERGADTFARRLAERIVTEKAVTTPASRGRRLGPAVALAAGLALAIGAVVTIRSLDHGPDLPLATLERTSAQQQPHGSGAARAPEAAPPQPVQTAVPELKANLMAKAEEGRAAGAGGLVKVPAVGTKPIATSGGGTAGMAVSRTPQPQTLPDGSPAAAAGMAVGRGAADAPGQSPSEEERLAAAAGAFRDQRLLAKRRASAIEEPASEAERDEAALVTESRVRVVVVRAEDGEAGFVGSIPEGVRAVLPARFDGLRFTLVSDREMELRPNRPASVPLAAGRLARLLFDGRDGLAVSLPGGEPALGRLAPGKVLLAAGPAGADGVRYIVAVMPVGE